MAVDDGGVACWDGYSRVSLFIDYIWFRLAHVWLVRFTVVPWVGEDGTECARLSGFWLAP